MRKQMTQVEQGILSLKTPKSPHKFSSPQNFLRKDSNLAGFAAWDVDGRVNSVDVHFNELKDMVSSSLAAQKVLEDAMELAKSRGQCLNPPGRWPC